MHSRLATQVYSTMATADREGSILPYRPFRGRVLLIKPDNINQRFELMVGCQYMFASPCPVHQFLGDWYNLLVRHAFANDWSEERLSLALGHFTVHMPTAAPHTRIMFRLHGEGEAVFTLIGDEAISNEEV